MYAHSSRPTTSQPPPVVTQNACIMPSVAPTYAIVGRPALPAIVLGSITATVERSIPPSLGTQLLLASLRPARMREMNVCFSAVVKFDASVVPRSVGALVVVAATFAVVNITCGGSRPDCNVVNTVRQLPLKFVPQPAAVTAGMWSAASNTTPDRLL